MVMYYELAGRKIGSHVLAMGVLGGTFAGAWLASRGGGDKKKEQGPPINASSKDEEKFIQDFLKNVDGDQKAKH